MPLARTGAAPAPGRVGGPLAGVARVLSCRWPGGAGELRGRLQFGRPLDDQAGSLVNDGRVGAFFTTHSFVRGVPTTTCGSAGRGERESGQLAGADHIDLTPV